MLTFDDNGEIIEMISDEDERVTLVKKINPQLAHVYTTIIKFKEYLIIFIFVGFGRSVVKRSGRRNAR